jgi:homocysteine S-methyltransferase
MKLMDRIAGGRAVLLDGAMGTELERRGVPMDGKAWSAAALDSHPEILRQVHGDYAHAGAEIHIANSFALARHVLEPAGFGDRVEAFNRRAVELCREAIADSATERPQWVAGSLSTFADQSDRRNLPARAQLRANYDEQAAILRAAGVDLFALEMLCDVDISLEALGAAAAQGLPVMIGFTCIWSEDGTTVEALARDVGLPPVDFGDVLPPVISAIPETTPAILAIMHSKFDVTDAALEVLQDHWSGPVAVYPNSGEFVYPNWQFDKVCSPEDFVAAARAWIDRGVRIVGGCCGIGPAHIRRLHQALVGPGK